jgi:hypothetical protein
MASPVSFFRRVCDGADRAVRGVHWTAGWLGDHCSGMQDRGAGLFGESCGDDLTPPAGVSCYVNA